MSGCGLRRSTPYIKVCLIIWQIPLLWKNGPKWDLSDSGKSKIVKKKKPFKRIHHSWNIADIGAWSKNHQCFVAYNQWGHKKRGEKKRCKSTSRDLRRIRHEATRTHYPPVLPYSTAATDLEYQEARGVQCSDMVEGREAEPQPPLDKSHRLKWAKKSLDRFFKGFVDWWDVNNSMTLVQPTRWMGPWLDQWWMQSSASFQTPARWRWGTGMGR